MPRELVTPFQAAPEARTAPAPLATIAAPAGQSAGAPLNRSRRRSPGRRPVWRCSRRRARARMQTCAWPPRRR
eukprot:8269922-Alexandrium_andersonii.AAC.1